MARKPRTKPVKAGTTVRYSTDPAVGRVLRLSDPGMFRVRHALVAYTLSRGWLPLHHLIVV